VGVTAPQIEGAMKGVNAFYHDLKRVR
jgi:hypothetical protein